MRYNIRRSVVDNGSNKIIGYVVQNRENYKFRKLRCNDVLTLIQRGEVRGASYSRVSGNIKLRGYDIGLIPPEFHDKGIVRVRFEKIRVFSGDIEGKYLNMEYRDFEVSDGVGVYKSIVSYVNGYLIKEDNKKELDRLKNYCENMKFNIDNYSGIMASLIGYEGYSGGIKYTDYCIISIHDVKPSCKCNEILRLEQRLRDKNRSVITLDIELAYNCLNDMYNAGAFSDKTLVEWSNRLTSSAGVCYCSDRKRVKDSDDKMPRIALSTHYHKKFENELIDTIAHEIIHLNKNNKGHDNVFKAHMVRLNQLGMSISIYSKGKAKVAHVYVCDHCGENYRRSRRIAKGNTCGVCGGPLTRIGSGDRF